MKHLPLDAIARRYYELFNQRRFDDAELLVSPQAVFHYPHTKEHLIGRAGYRELARTWVTAFPDALVAVQRFTVKDAHLVIADLVGRGTHMGTLAFGGPLTLRPSGRTAELPFQEMLDIQDGQIIELWLRFDLEEMIRRLTT